MGLILGLIGITAASKAIGKITETVSDVSTEKSRRSREKEEIRAESRRDTEREKTRRDITVAQIEADARIEVERTRAQAKIMSSRRKNGVYSGLYGGNNSVAIEDGQRINKAEKCFCPYCGKRIAVGDAFCGYCGNQI